MRLVAWGLLQKKGINYNQTYASVARMTSMQVVLAIAVHEGFVVEQLDINSAYLNGFIDTEVYISQPLGYQDPQNATKICHLNKGLYGIKQAGRIWNDTAHAVMVELGFTRASADYCVYIQCTTNGKSIIALHVDNFVIVGHVSAICKFLAEFLLRFSIKELGSAKFIVGLQIS